jgi:hypothetical protein
MANVIKIKRGTGNPGNSLQAYELGWDTSTNSLFIGNGVNSTLIANAFTDDLKIDSLTGNISVTNDFVVSGSTTLGDANTDTNVLRGTVDISDSTKMTTIKGTLNVDEAVTFDTTLGVTGNTTLGSGTTNVNTIRGTVNISDPALYTTVKGLLTVDGVADFNSTVNVDGAVELQSTLKVVNNVEIGIIGEATVSIDALTGNISTGGTVNIGGNLIVQGTTTTVESTIVTIADPIFTLGEDSIQDFKDRGIEFKYNNGTSAKSGFFGFNESINMFAYIPVATNTTEIFTGNYGNYAIGEIYQNQTNDLYIANGSLTNVSEKWNATYKIFKDGVRNAQTNEILQFNGTEFIATTAPVELTIDCGSY